MKSYLKFLSRNKLYTAIEAVGLAVSLAFVIIIGSYAWQQWAVTRENPDRKSIYTFNLPEYDTAFLFTQQTASCHLLGPLSGQGETQIDIIENS